MRGNWWMREGDDREEVGAGHDEACSAVAGGGARVGAIRVDADALPNFPNYWYELIRIQYRYIRIFSP